MFLGADRLFVLIRRQIARRCARIMAALGRDCRKPGNIADMFAALELRGEQAPDQRIGITPQLRPVDQAVRPQGIGAQADLRERKVNPGGAPGAADILEQGVDPCPTAEFSLEEGEIGFALGRRIRVEEKRAPAGPA